MSKQYIVIDFETYYDDDYSLRHMTPVEYIMHPRFECIGASVLVGDTGKAVFLEEADLVRFLAGLDPKKSVVVSHNALFDMCILVWRFGFIPALMIDTMSMARALLYHKTGGVSLARIARELSLPAKTDTIKKVTGMGKAAIKAAGLWGPYTEYANNDADICRQIFMRLRRDFPKEEFKINDMVIRCAVVPRFKLDATLLAEHLNDVIVAKENLLAEAGMTTRDELLSNEKFAQALRRFGVEPPMKVSLRTGLETYAFAKTDQAMADLEEHEDPRVQALVAARLGIKSTQEETRSRRFLNIAMLDWGPSKIRKGSGWMPIPLRYSGAHTHRLCLAGRTIICVLRNKRVVYIRLDHLRQNDLVWDGGSFVAHGGLAYAGIKQVIEHDGVVGTPDHRVWTLEYGYCPLAEAKARGTRIARAEVPDRSRIDPSVQWRRSVQTEDSLHMRELRGRETGFVERPDREPQSVVQIMRGCGADAGGKTLSAHVTARGPNKQRRGGEAESASLSITQSSNKSYARECAVTGTTAGSEVDPRTLEGHNAYSMSSVPALYEPTSLQLRLLWGERDFSGVCIDSIDGGLVVAGARSKARRRDARSHKHQRALYTGEPSVGFDTDTDDEPKFMETWDIVDCGPRNRFSANGRIVHNSGDWSLNLQNLPRGGKLRAALTAPSKCSVVACDASQIEARIVAWLAGQQDLLDGFREGRDIYSEFASSTFGRPVNKKDNPEDRFVGKTSILGLGYGMGGPKFDLTISTQSRLQLGKQIDLGLMEASRIVGVYRSKYNAIANYWTRASSMIPAMLNPEVDIAFGPVRVQHMSVALPNGLRLRYHNLRQVPGDKGPQWVYDFGGQQKKLYGGKLTENIVQALARIVVMRAAVRMEEIYPSIPLALQVHDELIYIVPDVIAQDFATTLRDEMSREVSPFLGLPLAAEYKIGKSYGDTK